MNRVSDFRHRARFRRVIAERSVADQMIASANSVNNLREIRRERNDAINFCGHANVTAKTVNQLAHLNRTVRARRLSNVTRAGDAKL